MKHYRCKRCDEVTINRHWHMLHTHKEAKAHKSGPLCTVDQNFEEVERIIGQTWTVKYSR